MSEKIKYTAQQIGDALRIEDPNFKGPSPEQIPIIESTHFGPTVIIAGAGSGKTETMSARVLWLVANGFVKPEEILGLTFTRKAAGELSSRIRKRLRQLRKAGLLPLDPQTGSSVEIAVNVSTYHSYAGRVLSEHAIRMGIDVSAEPIGEAAAGRSQIILSTILIQFLDTRYNIRQRPWLIKLWTYLRHLVNTVRAQPNFMISVSPNLLNTKPSMIQNQMRLFVALKRP